MKKFIGYIFILVIIFAGFFGIAKNINAQATGSCWDSNTQRPAIQFTDKQSCLGGGSNFSWTTFNTNGTAETVNAPTPVDTGKTAFQDALNQKKCSLNFLSENTNLVEGCLREVSYLLFFSIPAAILTIMGALFNGMLTLAISTRLYGGGFIESAWTVVRDISNIFFILILLYIAIQMILGLGGHDQKKMIGWVVVMALLINFSMLFTKVVIDSSNILALVFYNKITIEQKVGAPAYENPVGTVSLGIVTKDISGNLVGAFNITRLMTSELFKKNVTIFGKFGEPLGDSTSLMITIMIVAGAIMLVASYAFFIAGFTFIGRLVELWILIIFSPFAFMSFPVPKLSSIDGIGWSKWIDRLLGTAFMAPIFMFFMYLIARISSAGKIVPDPGESAPFLEMLLLIIIPSMVYIILLMKATEYAEKGGGQLGKLAIGIGKAAVGVAVVAPIAGVAGAGRLASMGLASASRDKGSIEYGKARSEWELHGKQGSFSDHWENYKRTNPAAANIKPNLKTIIGGRINASQKTSGEIDHARHELDSVKKKLGLEGVSDSRLSGVEAEKMKTTFIKEKQSDIEKEIRKGTDAKGKDILINDNDVVNAKGESGYKEQRRKALTRETGQDINNIDPSTGDLSDAAKKGIEDKLNSEFNEILRKSITNIGAQNFAHLQEEAKQKVGMVNRVASRSTSGTYDIRNIAGLTADKREGIGAKATIGLISAVAAGMRLGIKKTTGADSGTPKGNFSDLKQILNDAFKTMKVDIKLSDSGGGGHSAGAAAHAPDKGGHGGGHGGGDHGGGGGHH